MDVLKKRNERHLGNVAPGCYIIAALADIHSARLETQKRLRWQTKILETIVSAHRNTGGGEREESNMCLLRGSLSHLVSAFVCLSSIVCMCLSLSLCVCVIFQEP